MNGCSQSASCQDDEPEWQTLRIFGGWPLQQNGHNSSTCFNGFDDGAIAPGGGEALSIKLILDRMKTGHGSRGVRALVPGLSADGALTAVMISAHPGAFAGGANRSAAAHLKTMGKGVLAERRIDSDGQFFDPDLLCQPAIACSINPVSHAQYVPRA